MCSMKYLVSNRKAVNLANASEFFVSCNYLVITTTGGLNAREIKLVYGSEEELNRLFDAIIEFSAGNETLFDCDKFLGRK